MNHPPPSAFRKLVLSAGLTNLGDGIAVIAWAWVASLLTRDPLLIALLPVALRLPWVVFAIPVGVVTDRVDRRLLIVAVDFIRALAFAAAAVTLWLAMPLPAPSPSGVADLFAFVMLISAALVVGTAEVFRDNAAQTMLPSVVPHDQLERANGKLWSAELIANDLLGSVLGALLIAWIVAAPFGFNAVAYGAAALLVMSIAGDFRPPRRGKEAPNWRAEIAEAFAFLIKRPILRNLALITGFWNLFNHMAMIALILHVQENMGLGAKAYGLILAFGAVGGIIGGFVASHIVDRLGPARTTQMSLIYGPIGYLLIILLPGPVPLAINLAVMLFFGLTWNTVSVSYRQRHIPDDLLGRVNSLYRLLAWGMIPLGLVLSGLAVRLTDGPLPRAEALMTPFWVATVGALILGLVSWRALGRGFDS